MPAKTATFIVETTMATGANGRMEVGMTFKGRTRSNLLTTKPGTKPPRRWTLLLSMGFSAIQPNALKETTAQRITAITKAEVAAMQEAIAEEASLAEVASAVAVGADLTSTAFKNAINIIKRESLKDLAVRE